MRGFGSGLLNRLSGLEVGEIYVLTGSAERKLELLEGHPLAARLLLFFQLAVRGERASELGERRIILRLEPGLRGTALLNVSLVVFLLRTHAAAPIELLSGVLPGSLKQVRRKPPQIAGETGLSAFLPFQSLFGRLVLFRAACLWVLLKTLIVQLVRVGCRLDCQGEGRQRRRRGCQQPAETSHARDAAAK